MGLRDGGLRESLRAQGLKQGGLRGSLRNLNSTGPDIPDSDLLHTHWDASQISSIDPWEPEIGEVDLSPIGSPTLNTDAINDLNTVEYDGSNDGHQADSELNISPPINVSVAFRLITVDSSSTTRLWFGNTDDHQPRAGFDSDTDDFEAGWDSDDLIGPTVSDDEKYIAQLWDDGSEAGWDVNGTEEDTKTSPDLGFSNTEFRVAQQVDDRHENVEVYEILVYDGDPDRRDVDEYLNDKWDMGVL